MKQRQRKRRLGFTLVEVLLVLAILVILGSMVTLGVVQVQKNANIRAARSQASMLEEAVEMYRINVGTFPEQLQDLREQPSNLRNPEKWSQVLDKDIPVDPWGNDYQYEIINDDSFRIYSLGPDGSESGDDISTS